MNDCDAETGFITPIRYPAPRRLSAHTSLRAIGAEVLDHRKPYREAAARLEEEETGIAVRLLSLAEGARLEEEGPEVQALYLFFLAARAEAGDL